MRIFIAIFMTLLLSASIAVAGDPVVSHKVEVASERVTLGDILTGVQLGENVATQFVCKAPKPGRSREIQGSFLRHKLETAGINAVVPESVLITRKSNVVSASELASAAKKAVAEKARALGREVTMEIRGGLSDVVVPSGRVGLEAEFDGDDKPMGRFVLPIRISVDGQDVAKKYLDVEIETSIQVWALPYALPKGKVLAKEHLEQQTIALTKVRGIPLRNLDEIIGKRTTRALSAGTILVEDMVDKKLAVHRGDIVVVWARKKGIAIKAFGQVTKSGVPGQTVPVINLDSGEKIYANIIDSKSVEVSF